MTTSHLKCLFLYGFFCESPHFNVKLGGSNSFFFARVFPTRRTAKATIKIKTIIPNIAAPRMRRALLKKLPYQYLPYLASALLRTGYATYRAKLSRQRSLLHGFADPRLPVFLPNRCFAYHVYPRIDRGSLPSITPPTYALYCKLFSRRFFPPATFLKVSCVACFKVFAEICDTGEVRKDDSVTGVGGNNGSASGSNFSSGSLILICSLLNMVDVSSPVLVVYLGGCTVLRIATCPHSPHILSPSSDTLSEKLLSEGMSVRTFLACSSSSK